MAKTTGSKAISGSLWVMLERLSVQACQFVIGVVLARLLLPEDYGVIGMLAIFMALAQSILDSGFNRALIQKKDRNDIDYSTVFYFNLVVSIVIYAIFFVSASFIADFYNTPILEDVTKVVSISVIINAISLVQTAKLTIELNFKLQTIATLLSAIISGIIGIGMAYSGYGVWSLVSQSVSAALFRTVVLIAFSHWKPLFVFSVESFRKLFSFGSKLLLGDFIHTIYSNMYTLVIGKAFNASDVGYFNRANGFAILPPNIFGQVVNKVMFPVLADRQDDDISLLNAYNNMFRMPMFFFIPFMFLMAALSEPIIITLIGEKWRVCIPLMQVLCIGYIFSPLSILNLNLLYVKGRSDISLKLDLIKKPIGIMLLFASVPFGLWWMCFGKAVYDIIAFAMNCYYTKKLLNYGFLEQLNGIKTIIINSIIMFVIVIGINHLFSSYIIQLFIGFIAGIFIYSFCAYLQGDMVLRMTISYIKDKLIKLN